MLHEIDFIVMRKNSRAQLYCKHGNRENLGPNRTDRGSRIDIVSLKIVVHVTHSCKTPASMYTLSMLLYRIA